MGERIRLRKALVPALSVASIVLALIPGQSQAGGAPITEQPTNLDPIPVKTLIMQPGEIYKLPRYSVVMSNGTIVSDGKAISENPKTMLLKVSQKEALVSAPQEAKAQIDIAPENFQAVVANDIIQIEKETRYGVAVRDQKGWPLWKKVLAIGIPAIGVFAAFDSLERAGTERSFFHEAPSRKTLQA